MKAATSDRRAPPDHYNPQMTTPFSGCAAIKFFAPPEKQEKQQHQGGDLDAVVADTSGCEFLLHDGLVGR